MLSHFKVCHLLIVTASLVTLGCSQGMPFLSNNPIGESKIAGSSAFLDSLPNAGACGSQKTGGVANPFIIYNGDQRALLEQTSFTSWGPSVVGVVPNSILSGSNTILDTQTIGELQDLCPEEPFRNVNLVATCTGILIGADTIITAGHCIEDQSDCNGHKLIFNLSGANTNRSPSSPTSDDVFTCKEVLYTTQSSTDFAIIRLDRQAKGRKNFDVNLESEISSRTPLTCIGHSEGMPLVVSPEGSYQGDYEEGWILHDIDVFGGNSGAPIFAGDTVVGLHSRRFPAHYIEDSQRNCNVRQNLTTSPAAEGIPDYQYYSQAADTRALKDVLKYQVEVLTGKVLSVSTSGSSMVIEGYACALARPAALNIGVSGSDGKFLGTYRANLSLSQQDEEQCQSGASHDFRVQVPIQPSVTLTIQGQDSASTFELEANLSEGC